MDATRLGNDSNHAAFASRQVKMVATADSTVKVRADAEETAVCHKKQGCFWYQHSSTLNCRPTLSHSPKKIWFFHQLCTNKTMNNECHVFLYAACMSFFYFYVFIGLHCICIFECFLCVFMLPSFSKHSTLTMLQAHRVKDQNQLLEHVSNENDSDFRLKKSFFD